MQIPAPTARLALFVAPTLGLMLTVPFLMANHHYPLPAFFQEWTAALLGLLALSALFCRQFAERLEIPELSLLPLGLLALAGVQWLVLSDVLLPRLQMFSLYLLWATLLLLLGRQLAARFGLARLSLWFASALLAGALLQALSGVLQLEGSIGLPWIFPHSPGIGVRGNLAQSNSFSNYLWLGIVAAIHLRSQARLGRAVTAGCIAFLVIFAVLSGSRSTWLYAGGLSLFSSWSLRLVSDRQTFRRALRWSLATLAGAVAFQISISSGLLDRLLEIAHLSVPGLEGDGTSSAGARLLASGGGDPIRQTIWQAAWLTWNDHPWLGGGFGHFTWQVYQHVTELMPARMFGLPEHAHNLPLHFLAEGGLAAFALLLVCAWRWAAGVLREPWQPAHWYLLASLLILGLHSGLEYPLWYSFFLGPAALMAGALSNRNFMVRSRRVWAAPLATLLVVGFLLLAQLYRDYSLLEDLVYDRRQTEVMGTESADAASVRNSVFAPYLDLLRTIAQTEDKSRLNIKLSNCERALRFSATRHIVYKCAYLQALAGQESDARLTLRRAVAAYPAEAETLLPLWQRRAPGDPVMAALVRDFPPIAPASARR